MAVDPFGSDTGDQDAEDFLAGGSSVVAVKFPTVGHKIGGTVTDWRMAQQTDMDSGELLWFYNKKRLVDSSVPDTAKEKGIARPAMELVMDLQYPADSDEIGRTWKTLQHVEEEVPDDDGMRRAYISGEQQKALGEAMKEAGAKLEKGAFVEMVLTGTKKVPTSKHPRRTFKARWTKAADNKHFTAEADSFLADSPDEKDPFA